MESLLFAVVLEIGFFALYLVLKSLLHKLQPICVLCAATVSTWITLLVMQTLGQFNDVVVIAILMGGSCAGILYLFEKHGSKNSQVFKFPLYVTLVTVTYLVLQKVVPLVVLGVLAMLWSLSVLLFFGRKYPNIKAYGDHLIACCKNW